MANQMCTRTSTGHYGQDLPKQYLPGDEQQPVFVCPPFIIEAPSAQGVGEVIVPPTISLQESLYASFSLSQSAFPTQRRGQADGGVG